MARTKVKVLGPVVAALYEVNGDTFGHHVRRVDQESAEAAKGEPYACVEALIADCLNCGRTKDEHGASPETYLCQRFVAKPRCRCSLPIGDALP